MIIPISDVGAHGIVLDRLPHELPFGAWSNGGNVRFIDGYVSRSAGDIAIWEAIPVPTVAPLWLLPFFTTTTAWWIYAGASQVHATDGTNTYDISGASYNATLDNKWTGGMFNSIPVLNNTVNGPLYLSPVTPSTTNLAALPNWTYGTVTAMTCRVMRPFKNYLVAMDVTKTIGGVATRYPQLVKWSHAADPGSIPVSWNEADERYDTGEFPLADSDGIIVDSVPMRDLNVVYKEDSTHLMQYIGGLFIFKFARAFSTLGLLATNCAANVPKGGHVILSQDDVVWHNGQQAESILDKRMRKNLFANIDGTYYSRSFVFTNHAAREIWICIPEQGEVTPSRAYIWNWVDNTITLRDLANPAFITVGNASITPANLTWNADSGIWDSDSSVWDTRTFNPTTQRVIGAHYAATKIRQYDDGVQFNGTSGRCYVERTGLGIPFHANQPPDMSSVKFFRGIWPRIEGTQGGTVQVQVGTQWTIDSGVEWQEAQDYTIGTTQHIDVRTSGRLLAVRFETNADVDWRLHGYEVDVVRGGGF